MADVKPLKINALGESSNFKTGDTVGTAFGGTGATTPAQARINIGVQIGTNVQAWDAALDALAAVSGNGIQVRTGVDTYASRTLVQPTNGITIANNDGVSGNFTFALANDLAALEGLGATGFAVRIAADTWAQRSIAGTAGRTVVNNGDGVAGNPTVDLATLSDGGGGALLKFTRDAYGRVSGTSSVAALDLSGLLDSVYLRKDGGTMTNHITLHADPVNPMHAATMQYVDARAEGRRDKGSVTALMTTNVNVSNPGTSTFDGATLTAGVGRLMLVGQSAQAENGPWLFNGSGVALTRPVDFDANVEIVVGSTYFVSQGTTNADSTWTLISDGPFVLGTTALVFTQTSSLGQITNGNGLNKSGNTLSVNLAGRLTFNGSAVDLATVGGGGTGTKITYDAYGRVTSSTSATAADVGAQASSTELTALAALNTTGMIIRTGAGTYSPRSLVAPAAGFTITNPDGVVSNPTFALANDLAALEGLSSTGIAVRTGVDTWAVRSLVGVAGRTAITNTDGVAGNITVDLATIAGLTPGTYVSPTVTVDAYGRVTVIAAGTDGGNANTSVLTNAEASTVGICNLVYSDASGTFRKANANAEGTSKVQGMTAVSINAAASGNVITSGEVVATTGDWDAMTGQTGGLTINANYFLDNVTAGKMTTTVPASGFLVVVGRAESTTKFIVRIGDRFEL